MRDSLLCLRESRRSCSELSQQMRYVDKIVTLATHVKCREQFGLYYFQTSIVLLQQILMLFEKAIQKVWIILPVLDVVWVTIYFMVIILSYCETCWPCNMSTMDYGINLMWNNVPWNIGNMSTTYYNLHLTWVPCAQCNKSIHGIYMIKSTK